MQNLKFTLRKFGFDSLESDYQKNVVILDYLELSNDSINALNYLITKFLMNLIFYI